MRLNARIGVVHIAADFVSVALVKTGGVPDVQDFRREPVQPASGEVTVAEMQSQSLKKAAEPLLANAEAWVLCADSSFAMARRLTIPFGSRSRVKPAVPFELEPHLAFPIEEVAVDYVVIGQRSRETDVLAVAVRRSYLEAQLDVSRAAGIAVEGIGLDAIGLTALFQHKHGSAPHPNILLNLFDENAAVVLLERGKLKDLVFLPFGLRELERRPSETWRSVSNSLRSIPMGESENNPFPPIRVCGYEPTDADRTAHGWPGDEPPVFEGDLLPMLPAESPADSRMRDILAGCALAASGGGISLNYMDSALSAGQRPPGLRRRVAIAAALVAVLFVASVVVRHLEYRRNLARAESLGQEIHQVLATTFPNVPEAKTRPEGDIGGFKSFERLQSAAEDALNANASFSPEVFQRPPLLAILLDLAQRAPGAAVVVTDMKMTTGRSNEITLYGEANSAEALTTFLQNLRGSRVIQLDEGRLTRSSSAGRETFEIVAKF